MDLSRQVGLERIQKAALACLAVTLNAAMAYQTSLWYPRDKDFASTMQRKFEPVYLEEILPENFFDGFRPSLIDNPTAESTPNVSVAAYSARVMPQRGTDVSDSYDVAVSFDAMVKSLESESEVNARVNRTVEAIHDVVMQDPTFKGIVSELANGPNVIISDVFAASSGRSGADRRFIWQGGRLDYVVQKDVPRRRSPAPLPTSGLFGIDQL